MAYTTPTTRTTGELIDAADWNTDLVDNIKFLANPPACVLYHSTTQSLTDATLTALTFDTEDVDTDSMHSGAAATRITFNTAGLYVITGHMSLQSASDYVHAELGIRLDGTALVAVQSIVSSASAYVPRISVSAVRKVTAGQYVELRAYQDNSASAARTTMGDSTTSKFAAAWIGRG